MICTLIKDVSACLDSKIAAARTAKRERAHDERPCRSKDMVPQKALRVLRSPVHKGPRSTEAAGPDRRKRSARSNLTVEARGRSNSELAPTSGYWRLAVRGTMAAWQPFTSGRRPSASVSLQYFSRHRRALQPGHPLILYKGWKRDRADAPSWLDLLLAAGAAAGVVYWIVNYEQMAYRAGDYTPVDVWMGVVVIIVAIEVSRRVLGLDMALCAILPILYALFGNYLP